MVLVVLVYVVLAVAAWLKIGPIAGLIAAVGFLLLLYIASQPGASLFGSGPYSSASRPRSGEGPADPDADPADDSGHRRD